MKDGRIVEVTEVVGVEGSRVIFERYRPPHDTVLKRYRVAGVALYRNVTPGPCTRRKMTLGRHAYRNVTLSARTLRKMTLSHLHCKKIVVIPYSARCTTRQQVARKGRSGRGRVDLGGVDL